MSGHGGYRSKPADGTTGPDVQRKVPSGVVGKTTLVEQTFGQVVQRPVPAKPREVAALGDATTPAGGATPATMPDGPPAGQEVQRKAEVASPAAPAAESPPRAVPRLQLKDSPPGTVPCVTFGPEGCTVQPPSIQRKATDDAALSASGVAEIACRGVESSGEPLPHLGPIQQSFGHHDVSGVQAHTGPEAAASSRAIGAEAYATGNHVALGGKADLHTVAHEAAHVVQQRAGVQLKGGVGVAGDAYEQHADAVADKVVRGESAEALLDQHATPGGGTRAVQHKETDDAAILDHQAHLKNTDVEIPALEGALLATRLEAVKKGLLSQSAFDASLDLSRAMTQLQPTAAATKESSGKGPVDVGAQVIAVNAAQRLYLALQRDTADGKHFRAQPPVPSEVPSPSVTAHNPYTGEEEVTTLGLVQRFDGPLTQLPKQIHDGTWELAFRNYRELMNGLDRWVADQLRARGKGPPDAARADAHDRHAQHLTGLETIADKHATRLPALFHPDPETVEKEKAAGRPVADTIPMNVYVWKDDKTGKVHVYDLTTPGHPQEQTLDGPPTAAAMNTFFEEVARYPEGEVHYTLPDGSRGTSPTSGKVKWYEWVAYAGLLLAGIGLTVAGGIGLGLLAEGASVIATVCFATGTLAGGVSAGGHLVDSARLGTATTATVVLDVAQIAASFANLGAMRFLLKAGSASAALAASRYFVVGAAVADSVQLVALTDVTFAEMSKIQNGAGTSEDKQRAMSVLMTQLIVTGGLTALSVQGARNARALAGKQLEIVEQNGVKVARVISDAAAETTAESEAAAAKDMHWQMELKNKKLAAKGEPPRYPDLDAAVKQGLSDLEATKTRGFPYGFRDKTAFEAFAKELKIGVAGKPTPSGGIPVPAGEAAIQGSAVYRPAADDIDVALLVDQKQFDQLIEQSFARAVAKVRARGIDPLRMTMGDAQTAAEKTLANAVEAGIIKRDDVVPRLSDIRKKLETLAGKHVDLSIVRHGGKFDHGPYFPIP